MIYLLDLEKAIEKIDNRDIKVCVVGMGTVGLPLATLLANAEFKVTGFDINKFRVEEINSGKVPFEYRQMLKEVVDRKLLHSTTDSREAIKDADVIFVCVQTPLNKDRTIDLSKLIDATDEITANMTLGTVLILESSVTIGTTRFFGKMIEEKSGMGMGNDFGLAYCPERYNPGLLTEFHPTVVYNSSDTEYKHTLDKIDRVIGGIDKKSLKIAKTLYSQIISTNIKELSSPEAAEATKLLENVFRDVNIALVNELAKIYPKFGLDIYEVIDAAKTKPFAFLPHYPGAGVGGECIPVDTWYLIKQAESIGFDTKLLRIAREVNDSMPFHTIEILEEELEKFGKKLNSSNISVLGLSYKKNVPDTRLSPSLFISDILKSKNAKVRICDPIVEMHNYSNHNITPLSEIFKESDAVLLVTGHDVFLPIDWSKVKSEIRTPIIIDGRNFLDGKKITELGFSYRAIGKPG